VQTGKAETGRTEVGPPTGIDGLSGIDSLGCQGPWYRTGSVRFIINYDLYTVVVQSLRGTPVQEPSDVKMDQLLDVRGPTNDGQRMSGHGQVDGFRRPGTLLRIVMYRFSYY